MSEPQPLVSIITATYNAAGFIGETLRSVDAQTYPNIEHVFVDGASTDGTVELIEEYAAGRNVKWVSEPDSGVAEANNKGLQMAGGEIVVIVPADDVLFPWSVSTAMDYLRANPGVDLAYGDFLAWESERDVLHLRLHRPFNRGDMARTQCPTFVYFRRRVFHEIGGFDPAYRFHTDHDFWLRATDGRTVHRIPEIMGAFRKHAGTYTRAEGASERAALEFAELAVKYQYARSPLFRPLSSWDRLCVAVYRRALLLRMLYHSARVTREGGSAPPGTPWRRFLSTYTVSAESWRSLGATLLFPNRSRYEVAIRPRAGRDREDAAS